MSTSPCPLCKKVHPPVDPEDREAFWRVAEALAKIAGEDSSYFLGYIKENRSGLFCLSGKPEELAEAFVRLLATDANLLRIFLTLLGSCTEKVREDLFLSLINTGIT